MHPGELRVLLKKRILNRMRIVLFILLGSCAAVGQQMPAQLPVFKKDTFDIIAYGAKADAVSPNTIAIQKAIDNCSSKGGGVVFVPAGLWLTGPLQLRSNVNLHVSKNAVLQFSSNTKDFPLIKTNWEGLEAIRAQSPIYAIDVENIAITGEGLLDGAGQAWRPVKKNKLTSGEWKELVESGGLLNDNKDTWYPSASALKGSTMKRPGVIAEGFDLENAEEIRDFLRPNMVSIVRSKKVLLEGVTFQNSPAWCLHPLMIQHLTVKGITVRNPWNAQNGDGIDVESCRYVRIEDSKFDVGDDGICIKSGRDEEGRNRGIATEDVVVKNCTVFHGHGGFVVGSEMSGGVKNITVTDCNFLGTDIGVRFKTTRGRGGIVEKINISNIRMNNIGGAAILFDMYYMAKDPLTVFAGKDEVSIEMQPVNEGTPQFRDISITNVVCKGAETAVFVRGLPEMNINNVRMSDLSMETKKGLLCIEGNAISVRNSTFITTDQTVMKVQDSKNVVFDNIKTSPVQVLLNVVGKRSENITLVNTDVKQIANPVVLGDGVARTAVKSQVK